MLVYFESRANPQHPPKSIHHQPSRPLRVRTAHIAHDSAQQEKKNAGVSGVMTDPRTANIGLVNQKTAINAVTRRSSVSHHVSWISTSTLPNASNTAGR